MMLFWKAAAFQAEVIYKLLISFKKLQTIFLKPYNIKILQDVFHTDCELIIINTYILTLRNLILFLQSQYLKCKN